MKNQTSILNPRQLALLKKEPKTLSGGYDMLNPKYKQKKTGTAPVKTASAAKTKPAPKKKSFFERLFS